MPNALAIGMHGGSLVLLGVLAAAVAVLVLVVLLVAAVFRIARAAEAAAEATRRNTSLLEQLNQQVAWQNSQWQGTKGQAI